MSNCSNLEYNCPHIKHLNASVNAHILPLLGRTRKCWFITGIHDLCTEIICNNHRWEKESLQWGYSVCRGLLLSILSFLLDWSGTIRHRFPRLCASSTFPVQGLAEIGFHVDSLRLHTSALVPFQDERAIHRKSTTCSLLSFKYIT